MLERDAKVIEESMARFACLGLGLLYLNLQVEGWLYLESAFCVLLMDNKYVLMVLQKNHPINANGLTQIYYAFS